jgi:hypothetical protein
MVDIGRQVADGMPKGRHGVLDGQEHVVPPEILVPVLVEFFDGRRRNARVCCRITTPRTATAPRAI